MSKKETLFMQIEEKLNDLKLRDKNRKLIESKKNLLNKIIIEKNKNGKMDITFQNKKITSNNTVEMDYCEYKYVYDLKHNIYSKIRKSEDERKNDE